MFLPSRRFLLFFRCFRHNHEFYRRAPTLSYSKFLTLPGLPLCWAAPRLVLNYFTLGP